ncbi:MAG: CRISPR-associated endonuclease Cas2 [Ignisphaera sp.]
MSYVVVAYDISSNNRRSIAAEKLIGLGFQRIQKSVYMSRGGYTLAKEAYRALLRVIDKSTDSIVVVVVPKEYVDKILMFPADKGSVGVDRSETI